MRGKTEFGALDVASVRHHLTNPTSPAASTKENAAPVAAGAAKFFQTSE
jgi:hypothetical protein